MNNSATTLVKFWAPWCAPCMMMKPVVERVLADLNNEIELVDINVDEDPDMAREYNIRTIPTLILKRGNQIIKTLTGSATSEQLKEFLSRRT